MVWVRLDDEFSENPKIAQLSDSALALWVVGLAYCNRNLTDGFIPAQVGMGQLRYCDGHAEQVIAELVAGGFWVREDGGWTVHDYFDYQPSREDVEALREARREAGRLGGLASAQAKAKQVLEQNASKASSKIEANFNPVPGTRTEEEKALETSSESFSNNNKEARPVEKPTVNFLIPARDEREDALTKIEASEALYAAGLVEFPDDH